MFDLKTKMMFHFSTGGDGGKPPCICVSDGQLFVARSKGVEQFDIKSKSSVMNYAMDSLSGGRPEWVVADGGKLFAATLGGVDVFKVGNKEVDYHFAVKSLAGGKPEHLAVANDFLYVATLGGVAELHVSERKDYMFEIASLKGGKPPSVCVNHGMLYVCTHGKVEQYDIKSRELKNECTDPNPSVTNPEYILAVDEELYMGTLGGVHVFKIADKTSTLELSHTVSMKSLSGGRPDCFVSSQNGTLYVAVQKGVVTFNTTQA